MVKYFVKSFPILKHVDVLMGGDNLAPHCSESTLSQSRDLHDICKIVWAFCAGGCTDVVAGPDNNLVNIEKSYIRRAYRTRPNPDRWRKSRKDGGITMTERRRHLARWISEGRRYLLENHLHEIWKRHQECGFVLACDGSEDNKLHFRDGKSCFFSLYFKSHL